MTDRLAPRRKRLMFQSARRGTHESDLVLGGFARRHLATLSEDQLDRFDALLELDDPKLLGWIMGLEPVPAAHNHDVMNLLKNFKKSISSN